MQLVVQNFSSSVSLYAVFLVTEVLPGVEAALFQLLWVFINNYLAFISFPSRPTRLYACRNNDCLQALLRPMSHSVAVPKPLSRQPSVALIRSRTPSRTQLRHANAVRRFFSGGGGSELSQDQYQMTVKDDEGEKVDNAEAEAECSRQAVHEGKLKDEKVENPVPQKQKRVILRVKTPPPPDPYMRLSLSAVGVEIMADSANMESV